MSTTTKPNKSVALARVQALVAGTLKHFPNGSFTLGNTAYTTATLVDALQGIEKAITAVNTAQANARDAALNLRQIDAKVAPLLRDYKRFLLAAFSTATQQLADFGLQPPKARKPVSAETRAAAAAKLRATRSARGTTSKKQKLAVKGDVTGVIVTPVTSGASGAAAPGTPQPTPTPGAPPTTAAPPAPTTAPTAAPAARPAS